MNQEKSCGAIIQHDDKFLLVKSYNNNWGFPKGHVDGEETEEETALREVKEETGLTIELIEGFKETIRYNPSPKTTKTVIYFLGKTDEEHVTIDNHEIMDFSYLPYDTAYQQLTFKNTKEILKKAHEFLMKRHNALQ